MADLNPIISGEPVGSRFIVPPASGPLHVRDLPGSFNPEDWWNNLIQLESEAEELMIERMKDGYRYDPFRMRITNLSTDESQRLLSKLHDISAAPYLLAAGKGPTMTRDYWTPDKMRPERSAGGQFIFSPSAIERDPRALFLSQMTERFDWATHGYYPSGTHYRPEVLRMVQDQVNQGIPTQGNTFVFDVESPGLNREEGIWQMSGRLVGPDGELLSEKTHYFDNPKMHLGLIGPEAQTPHDYLIPSGASTDFVENMKDMMRMAQDADSVGGHNILFDYDMVSRSLKKHEAYVKDAEFRQLSDNFLAKFWNPETRKIGNVIDTSMLSRAIMPEITLAPELIGGPTPYRFSLQNILLQTDLLNRVKAEVGDDKVNEWLERGLHYADVDVPFEHHLLAALKQHLSFKRQGKKGGGRLIQFAGDNLPSAREREQILRSRPIGPNIALSHEGQLVGDLRDRADASGLINNITPLAQQVFQQRNMTLEPQQFALDNDQAIALRLNSFNRFLGPESDYGMVTHSLMPDVRGHIPTTGQWANTQRELADLGSPLPGLSPPERHIMAALSQFSGPNASHAEQFARQTFGRDLMGVSRFVEPETPRVVGNSNIVALPLKYIRGWEEHLRGQGMETPTHFTDGGLQMLGLSAFQYEPEPGARRVDQVALMLRMEHEHRRSLLQYLREHSDLGADRENLTDITEALEANSGIYGIQLGTLGGKGGPNADLGRIGEIGRHYQGIGADTSDQTPLAHVAFAGENLISPTEGDAIYGGGVFLHPELMSEREMNSLPGQITQMAGDYKTMSSRTMTRGTEQMFSNVIKSGAEGVDATKWLRRQRKVAKATPIVGGILAASSIAYYAYKKHEKKQLYAQTFQEMPTVNQASAPPGPRRSLDPTAQAGLVQNMDDNKINHNASGSDQYQHLFTGYY